MKLPLADLARRHCTGVLGTNYNAFWEQRIL